MKKNILILSLFLLTVVGCSKKNDNKQELPSPTPVVPIPSQIVNNNENVIKNQHVDGLDIENTSVVINDGMTKIITTVTNTTESEYILEGITIIVKDVRGNVIVSIPAYVGTSIQVGESKILNSSVDISLDDAYSFEYQVRK